MNTEEAISWLANKDIKSTPNRILVLKKLYEESHPVSLLTLSNHLLTMDKSSIFRVLSLFLEHDVVHAFEDGRGVLNYELCNHSGHCLHDDGHIHFYCESCQQSYCLSNLHSPHYRLPDGFLTHSVSIVIKGICPSCKQKIDKI